MLPATKIAACVVFYNPDSDVVSNIKSYYNNVDLLVVVDNSEMLNISLQEELDRTYPNLIYKFLNTNLGIAAALNIACNIALQKNYEWILTMDQDSRFIPGHFAEMIAFIPTITRKFEKVGIITPLHVLHEKTSTLRNDPYTIRKIAMTSGNLLNLASYKEVGPFEEKLFMDFVDYEYCLRLRKNNYLVVQRNSIHLRHSLGNYCIKKIVNRNIGVSNHSALRRYYMTRNSLYVGSRYFKYDSSFFFHVLWNVFFWDLFIIIIFEKDKVAKLNSVYKGFIHFMSNKLGKVA